MGEFKNGVLSLFFCAKIKKFLQHPVKVVYVRNRNKRKEYLCLISTDTNLDENETIRIYGKRWDIEVFFKVCKSYLCRRHKAEH